MSVVINITIIHDLQLQLTHMDLTWARIEQHEIH